jgi:DNA-binding PadR family transcriptional regulator
MKTSIKGAKPLSRLANTLTTGNIWLHVLSLIRKKGKVYAYALDSELENGSGFRPSKVMIYLVLYKLEAEGIIASEFEERRKYYRMTPKGKDALAYAKSYLADLAKKL